MRVLITQSGIKFTKGYRYELYERIREKGHTVCHLDQDISETFVDEDGDIHFPLKVISLRSNINPINDIKFILSLLNCLRLGKVDCILVYGVRIIPSVVIAAKLAGIKKCVCVINGAGKLFIDSSIKIKLLRLITLPMLKLAFALSNTVFFQNQDDYNLMIKLWLLSKKKAKLTNGSGVNVQKYSFEPLSQCDNFLLITRINFMKGVHDFIDAASIVKEKYPSANFHLVGPIDDLDKNLDWNKFESAICDGTIIYHGATNDVASFIKKSRCFVFPSFYREGVPRSVLEAMSMGRPIITTNSPGCRETVINGVNGFLVPPKSPEALAEKMIWMIENPEYAPIMGLESRLIAESKFNINNVNECIINAIF